MVTADELLGFRSGNPDAVRAVYREYGGLVFAVSIRTLGSRDLAEESTQRTFVKAWKAAAGFEVGRELGPWLATIARRTAIDIYRREAHRSTTP
ncbi:MAG: RNA polymerase sigma factor, partial [Ilumatobacteraceae bacterium]